MTTRSLKKKNGGERGPLGTDLRLPDPTHLTEGELPKSGLTRKRIMEAAVACLAQSGFNGTTVGAVAARAGLTRTAMLYHFPSRLALMEAVIHYVMRERLRLYTAGLATISLDDRDALISVFWEQLQTDLFRAFCELLNASRTDVDLGGIFGPAFAEYDRGRRAATIETFPEDAVNHPDFDLRRDIVRYLMEGLAMQDGLSYAADKRKADMLNFLRALLGDPSGNALLQAARNWRR